MTSKTAWPAFWVCAPSILHTLHPSILTTCWLGLNAICNDTLYPKVLGELSPGLHKASCSQARLGWDQLYHSHLSVYWECAIDTLNHPLQTTSQLITIQIVKAIWSYILDSWSLCNHHLHQDAGHLSLPDYQQAVKMLYELGLQLPPAVRKTLFQNPLQAMLEQPLLYFAPGLNAVINTWNNNWKLQKLVPNYTHQIFAPSSHLKHSPQMTFIHPRKPYYMATVWVFFVHISHREVDNTYTEIASTREF